MTNPFGNPLDLKVTRNMVDQCIQAVSTSDMTDLLDASDNAARLALIDTLNSGMAALEAKHPIDSMIDPEDMEDVKIVMTLHTCTKKLAALIDSAHNTRDRKQYVDGVRGVYRRRRCD